MGTGLDCRTADGVAHGRLGDEQKPKEGTKAGMHNGCDTANGSWRKPWAAKPDVRH